MAKVNVKVFGVKEYVAEANIVNDVFTSLNYLSKVPDSNINFNNTAVFLNNKPCTKKKTKLHDGDEVWIMSPAGGG